MGVPAFFRWLSRKYPSIVVECVDLMDEDGNPIDTSEPNPNNVEFDNLYLDMNGIIHPCTHPENKPPPKNEDEMMVEIFKAIDRIFSIVRPRKLLYLAIDGVAPRAKMNQQRLRRFRTSKESNEKVSQLNKVIEELENKGLPVPPQQDKDEVFDSNCITPGTPFMTRLAACLDYYVHDRMNTDPGWKGIKVILSDASVPGEGEHKIMDYIRKQRASPDYDPNTQHCLCGADADLIMLGLATHEANFSIIREEFQYGPVEKPCDICGQKGHEFKQCRGLERPQEDQMIPLSSKQKYIFVRLSVLREYLKNELVMESPNYDFERALDDWVCLCFFVGNDFLPHLPSLEIREGAIDRLVSMYKNDFSQNSEYLTDSGHLNLNKVETIMTHLGRDEDQIFRTRRRKEMEFRQRNKEKKAMEKAQKQADLEKSGEMFEEELEEEEAEPHDDVKLWENGYKERYYETKFGLNCRSYEDSSHKYKVVVSYVEGLCWVLRYYYQGCASWKWFFPYYYAPFASDFTRVKTLRINFPPKTEPITPLEQLMSVFPAASRKHLPAPFAELMVSKTSPVIDLYPSDFKIDLNGKKFAWQGVVKLPFVDEKRLKNALIPLEHLLTPEEVKRNQRGDNLIYCSGDSKMYAKLQNLSALPEGQDYTFTIERMSGIFYKRGDFWLGSIIESPVDCLPPVTENKVFRAPFKDPEFPEGFTFPAKRLPGVVEPPPVLKPQDFPKTKNFRPQIGFSQMPRASFGMAGHRMLHNTMGPAMPQQNYYGSGGDMQNQQQRSRGGYYNSRPSFNPRSGLMYTPRHGGGSGGGGPSRKPYQDSYRDQPSKRGGNHQGDHWSSYRGNDNKNQNSQGSRYSRPQPYYRR